MSIPEIAAQFLRERLPDAVSYLAREWPEVLTDSFVADDCDYDEDDECMHDHSEVVCLARMIDGGRMSPYILGVHGTEPPQEKLARLHLLARVVTSLLKLAELETDKNALLPCPVPFIVYHGLSPWNFSTDLADLFEKHGAGADRYVPHMDHVLVDLTQIDDESLSQDPRLRTFLKVMKYIHRPDLEWRLDGMVAEISALEPADRSRVISYLENAAAARDRIAFKNALRRIARG